MIVLKVKERGHLINIPGMVSVRSPVEIDITKHEINLVITNLRKQGIKNYKITEKDDSHPVKKLNKTKEFYVENNYRKEINNKFNNLENMISDLISNKVGNLDQNLEQITDKLEVLDSLTRDLLKKQRDEILTEKVLKEEPTIEELEKTFIPNIDIDDMEMKGESTKITVQQDEVDQDDIDLLSKLLGGKGGK